MELIRLLEKWNDPVSDGNRNGGDAGSVYDSAGRRQRQENPMIAASKEGE